MQATSKVQNNNVDARLSNRFEDLIAQYLTNPYEQDAGESMLLLDKHNHAQAATRLNNYTQQSHKEQLEFGDTIDDTEYVDTAEESEFICTPDETDYADNVGEDDVDDDDDYDERNEDDVDEQEFVNTADESDFASLIDEYDDAIAMSMPHQAYRPDGFAVDNMSMLDTNQYMQNHYTTNIAQQDSEHNNNINNNNKQQQQRQADGLVNGDSSLLLMSSDETNPKTASVVMPQQQQDNILSMDQQYIHTDNYVTTTTTTTSNDVDRTDIDIQDSEQLKRDIEVMGVIHEQDEYDEQYRDINYPEDVDRRATNHVHAIDGHSKSMLNDIHQQKTIVDFQDETDEPVGGATIDAQDDDVARVDEQFVANDEQPAHMAATSDNLQDAHSESQQKDEVSSEFVGDSLNVSPETHINKDSNEAHDDDDDDVDDDEAAHKDDYEQYEPVCEELEQEQEQEQEQEEEQEEQFVVERRTSERQLPVIDQFKQGILNEIRARDDMMRVVDEHHSDSNKRDDMLITSEARHVERQQDDLYDAPHMMHDDAGQFAQNGYAAEEARDMLNDDGYAGEFANDMHKTGFVDDEFAGEIMRDNYEAQPQDDYMQYYDEQQEQQQPTHEPDSIEQALQEPQGGQIVITESKPDEEEDDEHATRPESETDATPEPLTRTKNARQRWLIATEKIIEEKAREVSIEHVCKLRLFLLLERIDFDLFNELN